MKKLVVNSNSSKHEVNKADMRSKRSPLLSRKTSGIPCCVIVSCLNESCHNIYGLAFDGVFYLLFCA